MPVSGAEADGRAAAAVSLSDFEERLAALGAPRRFAIAVSGGRDSMALAVLASRYAKRHGGDVLVLIVDHGLRAGSREEAAQAARWCETLSLTAEVLTWKGEKPASGVQAAARAARYRLLCEACYEHDCVALMTAHHLEDQAETVLMRRARNVDGENALARGLSAMAPETLIAAGAGAPVRLLRPLLGIARARLTAILEASGQPYIDDPSNEDRAFERVRVRQELAAMEAGRPGAAAALAKTADEVRAARRREDMAARALFREIGGVFTPSGGASFSAEALAAALNEESAGAMLANLAQAVTGADHRPNVDAVRSAAANALDNGASTLAGVLMKRWRGRLYLLREPGAVLGRAGAPALAPLLLPPGARGLFDRRVLVTNIAADPISIAPAGEEGRLWLRERGALSEEPAEAAHSAPFARGRDGAALGAAEAPDGVFSAENLAPSTFFEGPLARF
ncbi:MAG: tRNA lysidine(34) synthetase TilS [Pseudomonadota bacterium]